MIVYNFQKNKLWLTHQNKQFTYFHLLSLNSSQLQCLPAILLMLLSTSNGEGQNDFGAGKAKKIQIVYIKVPLSKVLQQSGQQIGMNHGMKVNHFN